MCTMCTNNKMKNNNLPIAAEHIIEIVFNAPSEQNASFPSSLPLPKQPCNLGPIIRLQYEYTPKYNPTLGMEPNADTPSPAYKLNIPPGRDVTCFPASSKPSDFSDVTCCWTVFIVSNGANIVLLHAAAKPEASVFFRPSVMAVDFVVEAAAAVDFADDTVETEASDDFVLPPPRGMLSTRVLGWCMSLLFKLMNNLADVKDVCNDMSSSARRRAILPLFVNVIGSLSLQ